jgi:hypothetical protein
MINQTDIQTGLYKYISSMCPGWRVFKTIDNAARPDTPCISIRQTKLKRNGSSICGDVNVNTGNGKYYNSGVLTIELVAYGENSIGILDSLNDRCEVFENTLSSTTGLSILNMSEVQDISGLNDTIWEERATCTIEFTIGIEYTTRQIGYIDNAEIEVSFVSENGDIKTTTEIIES